MNFRKKILNLQISKGSKPLAEYKENNDVDYSKLYQKFLSKEIFIYDRAIIFDENICFSFIKESDILFSLFATQDFPIVGLFGCLHSIKKEFKSCYCKINFENEPKYGLNKEFECKLKMKLDFFNENPYCPNEAYKFLIMEQNNMIKEIANRIENEIEKEEEIRELNKKEEAKKSNWEIIEKKKIKISFRSEEIYNKNLLEEIKKIIILNEAIFKERNFEKIFGEIDLLKNELDKEKNKTKNLELKNKELFEKIQELNKRETQNNLKELDLLRKLYSQDEEIKRLNYKLKLFPCELSDGEKLISVIFLSKDESILFSIICKTTDTFMTIENKLYARYPTLFDSKANYLVNGNKIDKLKKLDENKIGDFSIISF